MRNLIKAFGGAAAKRTLTRWRDTRAISRVINIANQHINDWSADEAVEFLFSPQSNCMRPWQIKTELVQLARLLEHRRPKVIIEIGTAAGGTLFLASRLAARDALIISIDLPLGDFGGGYPDWKVPLYRSFARDKQRIELIRDDSHSERVMQKIVELLNGRNVDYLFIDGDHTYDGVKRDFDEYSKLLAATSIVAMHDIVPDKSDPPNHFVSFFWEEVKHRYEHNEFVSDRQNQSKLGLGVLFVNH